MKHDSQDAGIVVLGLLAMGPLPAARARAG